MQGQTPPTGSRSRRAAIVAALLVLAVVAYGLLLTRFDVFDRPKEQSFGAPSQAAIGVYIQPVVVNPLDDSMQIRVTVTSPRGRADPLPLTRDTDLVLMVQRGTEIETLRISPDQPRLEETFTFDLNDGSVHDYPLDSYRADIAISGFAAGSQSALPIVVRSWEGIIGYTVRASAVPASQPGEVRLRLDVHRTGAIKFFGFAAYGAMIVMAINALMIGTLTFVGVRRIEVTLVGAVGAIVFALPALRNALPGSPPFGVSADILVFFWAEFSAVIALGLFVTAWAGRGARP